MSPAISIANPAPDARLSRPSRQGPAQSGLAAMGGSDKMKPAPAPWGRKRSRVRIGYFDCFSGISGDMTLGALVDAGVDPRAIQSAVASLGLTCELTFETVRRGGFRATYAKVQAPHEHAHRHLHHIEALIDKGTLTPRQNELAKRIFLR